jgi:hypothetical protein
MIARSRLLSGAGRVWLLTSFLAVAALGMYLTVHRHAPAPVVSLEVPWWLIAIAFCLAEIFVVHIEIRREAYSYSLSEVPLVVGLFFLEPGQLILTQCVGASVALIAHRRQSPLKVAFNISHLAVEAAIAGLVFVAIAGNASPEGAMSWMAAFAATSATALVADVSVFIAISLAEARLDIRALLDGLAFSRAMQFTNTSLGLLAVQLLWAAPAAAALLSIPMAAVLLAYRGYNRHWKRH